MNQRVPCPIIGQQHNCSLLALSPDGSGLHQLMFCEDCEAWYLQISDTVHPVTVHLEMVNAIKIKRAAKAGRFH